LIEAMLTWDNFEAIDDNACIDEFPKFFEGAQINFAENVLGRKRTGTAIINMREDNMWNPEIYSWQDLEELVARYANALRASGLHRGEVVSRACPFAISPSCHGLDRR
jgi:acetoacetyl-CoA synthetase